MRVFLTGATGFVGSAIVPELLNAGHQVLGLARSDEGAKSLAATGAKVHRGNIEDLDSLRSGAAESDAVIHTAFNHDFSKFSANCEADRQAIEAMGSVLAGSDRSFIVTSGLALQVTGRPGTEQDEPIPPSTFMPRASEITGLSFASRGVRASVVRLPQVHDRARQGLITYLIAAAHQAGESAYLGEGLNRWAAVHVLDAARLYRLVLEKGETGGRYHAVAEEGISFREIAEVIGRKMNLPVVSKTPEEVAAQFGFLANFAGRDLVASSAYTQQKLGWHPTEVGLITDLENGTCY